MKSKSAISMFKCLGNSSKAGALIVVLGITAGCNKPPPPAPQQPLAPPTASAPMPPMNDAAAGSATDGGPLPGAAPMEPTQTAPVAQPQPQPPPPPPAPVVLPAGSWITVRLDAPLSSRTNSVGDQFSATVSKAIVVKGRTVIDSQAAVVGKVVDARAAGKFAGDSSLGLRLVSVADHQVTTSAFSQQIEGKGKRSGLVIGGTALAGALIGGLAGHGRGALIGGAVGGGAGTLGAAETGNNRDVLLPAGSVLTFKLARSLTLPGVSATPGQ